MKFVPGRVLAVLVLAVSTGIRAFPGESPEDADRHFLDRVRPLLESRCVSCHGPDKQKGNLRLDSRAAALKGGDLGPAVVPGKPLASLLLQAVMHSKADLEMPPKDKLGAREIAILERWIRDDAPWPAADASATPEPEGGPGDRLGDAWSDPRNPIVRIFNGQRLDLWSLRPVQDPPVPTEGPHGIEGPGRNPIDRFIDRRLAEHGLARSREADRRALARRVSYDLTGLPPTPEAVMAFVASTRPDAYESMVDELLSSPRYGEHQARLWLDVIRYSDSNGYDWDEFRPQAWRFRDYVVRAFNSDKPFDQFLREQLAGDELVEGAPRDAADQDRLIATGYLRVGPQDNSASLFNEQARARAEWLADLTETTGSAFLGVTLACCRCHDHKFDPLSQADHFRFRAFFEPIKYGDDLALDLAPVQDAIRRQHEEIQAGIAPLAHQRDELLAAVKRRLREERIGNLPDDERRLLAMASDPQPQDFKEQAAEIARKVEPSDRDVLKALSEDETRRHAALGTQIDALNHARRPWTRGLLASDTPEKVPPTHVLFQGDPKAEREAVLPGFLSILDPNPAELHAAPNRSTTGRRLALADWIVSSANPLTARVSVNRAWQSFFGRGLVATPNDFGLAGSRPSHPELLDWLAREFMRQGWSNKRLHRLIVTSATYRQASDQDPAGSPRAPVPSPVAADVDNALLWRQNLRRLTAEQLRDSLLAAAGTLQDREGGPPIWPELPAETIQANPAFLDDNPEKTKGWYPSPPDQQFVRTLFVVQKRTVKVPFLETFDLPENSVSCPRRTLSVVAPQALSLLNSTESLQAAHALAKRIEREVGVSGVTAVSRVFELALQRAPRREEAMACEAFLGTSNLTALCRVMLNLNEFVYLD